LDRVITQITVYRGGLLGAHKADGRWALAGDRSFEAYRGRTSRTGTGAARGEMELAEALAELPAAAAALHAAEVTLGHARELARLHNRADAPCAGPLSTRPTRFWLWHGTWMLRPSGNASPPGRRRWTRTGWRHPSQRSGPGGPCA
jgi:hypothetical protein